MSAERVLIVAHGHPDLSFGGGEIAAYAEWTELRRNGVEAMFVGWTPHSAGHPGTPFTARSADGRDLLFAAPPVDHFRHSQRQHVIVYQHFRELLDQFQPTVVHFHHYVHLGLELIREVRKYSPSVRIVMTLHEFLAICHAQGQMLKTSGMLCKKANPFDCHLCFPDISPQDFFMRELFVKSFLNLVDLFICPSAFLRERYIVWGIPPEKLVVIENGQTDTGSAPTEQPDPASRTRFVLLGQLSHLKGALVLLDALKLLPKALRKAIRIEIHGSLQYQSEEFKKKFEHAVETLGDTVRYCGPYFRNDVASIVSSAGWVIVPSIWWENSPLVIQEAFSFGRPVICGNVGGMAEKVTDGTDGLHFSVGNAASLARRIEEAATTPGLWERLREGVRRPPRIEQTTAEILSRYAAIRRPAVMAAAGRKTASS